MINKTIKMKNERKKLVKFISKMLELIFSLLFIERVPLIKKAFEDHVAFVTDYNITSINGTYYHKCSIYRNLQPLYVITNHDSSNFDVSIDQNLPDARYLFRIILSKNKASVISKNKIGKCHITGVKENGAVPIEKTEFKFIQKPIEMHVMTAGFYPHHICPNKFTLDYKLLVFCASIVILFLAIIISTQKIMKLPEDLPKWFIPLKKEVSADFFKSSDKYKTFFLNKSYTTSKSTGLVDSAVGRLFRGEQSQTFERIATIPLNDDYRFQIYWHETPDPPKEPNLKVTFESKDLEIIGDPEVSFSSFRSFRPITIGFTFDYNVRGKLEIPAEFIAPFQPFGQLVTNANHIIHKISDVFKNSAFLRSNFSDILIEFCKIINAKSIYAVNQDKLIITSFAQKQEDLLTDEEVYEMIGKIPPNAPIHYYTREILPNRDLCYVSHHNDAIFKLDCVLVFYHEPINKIFRELGVRILMEACLFVYRFINAREQSQKFEHFLQLLSNSKTFTFAELTDDGKPLIYKSSFKSSAFPTMPILPSPEIIKDPTELEQYKELFEKVRTENYQMRKFNYHVSESNGDELIPKILSVSAVSNNDPVLGKNVMTIFAEEVSKIKQQKSDLFSALNDLSIANKVLGLYKFTIHDKELVLSDGKLLLEIGFKEPNSLILNPLIHPDDKEQISRLIEGKKVIFRIQGPNSPVWYSAVSNRVSGFLFCVNYLLDVHGVCADADMKFEIPQILIWGVEVSTQHVFSLYEFPSIWDALNVDKETEFSYFINFIHEESHANYARQYQRILHGSKQNLTEEFRFIKSKTEYDWVRLTLLRRDSHIICVLNNINSIKETENEEMAQFAERNSFFLNARMMPWVFENRMDEIQNRLTAFEPGISKLLTMNWWFIDHFVENKEEVRAVIENMHEKIGKFHMVCRLNYENPVSILINGEHKRNGTALTGFCIEINSIFKSWSELVKKYDAVRVSHQKGDSIDKNVKHELYCTFNDIYCGIDLMTIGRQKRPDVLVLDAFTFVLGHLIDILNNQYEDVKYFYDRNDNTEHDLMEMLEFILAHVDVIFAKREIKLNVFVQNIFPQSTSLNYIVVAAAVIIQLTYAAHSCKGDSVDLYLSFEEPNAKIVCKYSGECNEMVKAINPMRLEITKVDNDATISLVVPAKTIKPFKAENPLLKAVIVMDDGPLKEQIIRVAQAMKVEICSFDGQNINNSTNLVFYEENKLKDFESLLPSSAKTVIVSREPFAPSHIIHGPLIVTQTIKALVRGRSNNLIAPRRSSVCLEPICKRILVVEDSKTNSFVLQKILDAIGCTSTVAGTGEEALRLLEDSEEGHYDLMIMDLKLPVLDGIQATRIIRKNQKWYSNIYIIGISAASSCKADCLNAGMNEFVPKPLRVNDIRMAILQSYA